MTEQSRTRIDWVNVVFLTLTPIIGIAGTALYTWKNGFEWWMLGLFVVMYSLVGMSICAGYHRLFSHRAYDATGPVAWFYAFFGAMAAQNSVLEWSSQHRIHHKYVDRDWDPYNIRRGFWWAHIFWIFFESDLRGDYSTSPDLLKNKVVMWQHRYYKGILLIAGFGIPTLVGWAFGDALAGLLWGGFLRIVAVHHSTFFVNSLAHKVGTPRYAWEVSARDNWAVALLTFGEGYHSFHHRFSSDYRNGVRWWHWDPAKWLIVTLHKLGLASNLKMTPAALIEKARLQAAMRRFEAEGAVDSPLFAEFRDRMTSAAEGLESSLALWREAMAHKAEDLRGTWREKHRAASEALAEARREWREAVRWYQMMAEGAR